MNLERFYAKVDKDGPAPEHRPELGSCWLWKGSKDDRGYGMFAVGGRRCRRAHCIAFEVDNGPVVKGFELDHLCRVPSCVNPAHLEAVTHAENVRRGVSGQRQRSKSACVNGHPLIGDNLYVTPDGRRQCRECGRQRNAVARMAQR